ncbi:LysR family transcriptional regulator [Aliidiomarina iranensis]|uniref:LysR family transcriptional regulator n=1 Tax=Aliidiomarina iranensis TaxID=1434071 RepID=A0A432W270_9GAMM|nr:LysR family transcriptional regulator [Aliidiomarina iranensis]RUO23288.1 LysR family transcriptional regulator [Aliidiomarina iranensis]
MSRLNYKHLYYFWRVAASGSLTATAQQLHVSQSALSMQIKQLEESVGIPLFIREKRSLTLTPEGERILQYASEIFSIGETLESLINSGFSANKVHINIGVLANLSRNFVERFVEPLLTNNQATFTLHSQSMEQLLEGLSNQTLDLALTNLLPAQSKKKSRWNSLLVSRQQLAIIGPTNKPENYGEFPNGYADSHWILPTQGTEIRNIFDTLCASFSFKPQVQAEADDMAMLRLLARDSGALSVLPPVVVRDEIANNLLQVFQHLSHGYEHFYALTLQHKRHNDVVRELLQQSLGG